MTGRLAIQLAGAVTLIGAGAAYAQPPSAPAATEQGCRSPANPNEIVVCGRDGHPEQYRLPPPRGFDPSGTTPSVPLERFMMFDIGNTGIGSCSTVGPGGWTGCQARQWERDRLQWSGQRPGGRRGEVSVRVGATSPRGNGPE